MPNSHQEMNAFMLMRDNAAIILNQNKLSAQSLTAILRKLLFAHDIQTELKHNIGKTKFI